MLAFHAIFTVYGFWLPNDPRGSWSDWVASWDLFRAGGPATKVNVRRSVAGNRHDAAQRIAVKHALRRPPVQFTGPQALAVSRGFVTAIRKSGHQLLACAILPDHVHVVVRASRRNPRRVVGHLKREAALQLLAEQMHPFQRDAKGKLPSCWAENSWCVYLDELADVRRAIQYVELNPVKEGKPKQRWSFITTLSHATLQ
jgi:REP element-mobilizing transposase RayT